MVWISERELQKNLQGNLKRYHKIRAKGAEDRAEEAELERLQKEIEEERKRKDREPDGLLGALTAVGDFASGANDKFYGGIRDQLIDTGAWVASGFNGEEADRRSDEFQKKYFGRDPETGRSAISQGDEDSAARRAGEIVGQGQKLTTDIASLVIPGAAAEKVIRGTRAVSKLANAGRKGNVAANVVGSVGGGLAATTTGAALDPRETVENVDELGSDLATGVGLDAALGALGAGGSIIARGRKAKKAADAETRAAEESQRSAEAFKADFESGSIGRGAADRMTILQENPALAERARQLDDIERTEGTNSKKYAKLNDSFEKDMRTALAQRNAPSDSPAALLGSGEDSARARLAEIEELEEAVRSGDTVQTSYRDMLPRNVNEAGTAVNRTEDSEAVNTRWNQFDEAVAPINQRIDEIHAAREDALNPDKYGEASKNIEMQFNDVMKEAEKLPPLRQEAFIRIRAGELEEMQRRLDDEWAHQDDIVADFESQLDDLEKQRYTLEREAQLEVDDIISREGIRREELQEQVRNMPASQLRQMRQEKRELQRQIESIEYSKTLASGTPINEAARQSPPIDNQATQQMDDAVRNYQDVNPDKNIGLLEGTLTTREVVIRKAGPAVAKVWDEKIVPGQQQRDFAMHQDTEQLTELANAIKGDPKRATKIFNALEAEDFTGLDDAERSAAEWFRDSFAKLADLQGLPAENRISGYVTHLFDGKRAQKLQDAQQKLLQGGLTKKQEAKYRNIIYQSDPELLRLMRKNASGKINNKYLEKRTGAEGYETDPFQAYMVYAKKAYTKAYLEEGLDELADYKDVVSKSMRDYINDTINAIKQVPGEQRKYQELINNSLISLSGGRLDPSSFERGTRATSNQIYRGTLQYNFGTALTNLQQMGNTFGEVGTKHLMHGFNEAMGKIKSGDNRELHEMGILEGTLSEALINDKSLIKDMLGKGLQKSDKAGWYMFQTVEEMNRGTAYYAAKSKGLAKGMSEEEARQYGAKIARKTQFKFSEMDTPPALNGPIAKNFTQLLTFSVKQVEYLKRSVISEEGMFVPKKGGGYKLSKEGGWKVARLVGGYTVVGGTIGQITGIGDIDYSEIAQGDFSSLGNVAADNIPFYSNLTEGSLPMSPMVQFLAGSDRGVGVWNVLSGTNQYGRETDRAQLAQDLFLGRAPGMFIPGGTQMKKTIEGATAANQGYSETGKWYKPDEDPEVRFSVDNPYDAGMATVFGQYNTSGGREYVDEGMKRMNPTETKMFKGASPAKRKMYEDFLTADNQIEDAKKRQEEIGKAVREQKNINRARRLALEYNADIDELFEPLLREYQGMVPKELLEYVESKKISPLERNLKRRDR